MQKKYIGFILLLLLFSAIYVFYTKTIHPSDIKSVNISDVKNTNIGGGNDLKTPSVIEKKYNEE